MALALPRAQTLPSDTAAAVGELGPRQDLRVSRVRKRASLGLEAHASLAPPDMILRNNAGATAGSPGRI